jgi:hypothetical protein
MYNAVNAGRKRAFYISVNVSFLFLGVEMMGGLLLRFAWFVGHTVNQRFIIYDDNI